MTKGAIVAMTYSVARDYVSAGVRCVSISPARIHTPFVDGYIAKHYPGREAEMFATLSATQPVGRMGTPKEVADLALFLALGRRGVRHRHGLSARRRVPPVARLARRPGERAERDEPSPKANK
jgi:NAD(P)-dependent dehydrogenase (short-subunit alcohol dehydrogenase family)